jgi:hypothetical protein
VLLCLLEDLTIAGDAASPIRNLIAFWHRRNFMLNFSYLRAGTMLIFSYPCVVAPFSKFGRSNEILGWEGFGMLETIICFAFLKCKLTVVIRVC